MIETIAIDVGDISTGRHTRSHKQLSTGVALMTQIIDTSNPESDVDACGKLEREKAMQHEIDYLQKNQTWDLVP